MKCKYGYCGERGADFGTSTCETKREKDKYRRQKKQGFVFFRPLYLHTTNNICTFVYIIVHKALLNKNKNSE